MRNLCLCISLLFSLVLVGCCSSGNQCLAKMDSAQANQLLIDGKSTKPAVQAALGSPSNVDFDVNGNEKWTFKFTHKTLKASSFIPYANLVMSGTNDDNKKLVVIFDKNGIVQHHSFIHSQTETKRGIAA